MAVKAVLFDEQGKVIKEVTGDLVKVMGVTYRPFPFGIGIELSSASAGKLIPETLPEILGESANNMIEKAVRETKGEEKADEIRLKTAYIIASGGIKSNG